MVKKYFKILFAACSVMVFSDCGNRSNESLPGVAADSASVAVAPDSGKVEDLARFKYDKLISNIPIPFDILQVHMGVPLTYNLVAVNPVSNLTYYSSANAKALNLGIYGGDMAYCITYREFDDVSSYFKCAKKLSNDLGIPLAFDQKALRTCEKYSTNKDTLEKIVYNSYAEVDKTLKSNERIGLASLVVAGGWLEGLYATLTTMGNIPKNEKSAKLYNKIWEQKNYLSMIIGLLEQFKNDKSFTAIIQDLKGIESVYDGFSDSASLNEAGVATLAQKVGEVRSRVIGH